MPARLIPFVVVVSCVTGAAAQSRPLVGPTQSAADVARAVAGSGHPPVRIERAELDAVRSSFSFLSQAGEANEPAPIPFPPFSPVVRGSFVNFESPLVKGLALTSDGGLLLATNTPNNTLTVIAPGVDGELPRIVAEVPVGLDPVSVGVQPGDAYAWVANMISDDISVVNLASGRVETVIPVGDEPVNILFSPAGDVAYVVLQGPAEQATVGIPDRLPYLVTIDTATRACIHTLRLPMNNPRAAVLDAGANLLLIADLHSGNQTTLAGLPVPLRFTTDPNENPQSRYSLDLVQQFSLTGAAFDGSDLGPWPDVSAEPGAPRVPRIVRSADVGGDDWQAVLDLLRLPDGTLDPAAVAQFDAEFGTTNGAEVLQRILDDVKTPLGNDVALIDVSDPRVPAVAGWLPHVGATLHGMALHPQTQRVMLTNTVPRNTVRTEPNLRGHIVDHQVVIVQNPLTPTVVATDLHAGLANFHQAVSADAGMSLASPRDIVFNGDGSRAYVAGFGPGRIGVLDGRTAEVLGRVDVGRGPRSLAYTAGQERLYVFQRTDHSIATLDVSSDAPVLLHTLYLFNPEPPEIKQGRDFIYSTNFSANQASACATCHVDAHLDHTSWDLGEPQGGMLPVPDGVQDPNTGLPLNHPTKGPMVTQSLRGLDGHNSFHWRGDKPTLQDFNGAFDKLLGGSELPDSQIDAMAAFVETIQYPPTPFANRDNSFKDPRYIDGFVTYFASCDRCHALVHDGSQRLPGDDTDRGFILTGIFAQIQEVAQLRGIHDKFQSDVLNGFGVLHDGRIEREDRPADAIPDIDSSSPMQSFFETFVAGLDPDERDALEAYFTGFQTNVMPVVGWQVAVTGPAPDAGALLAIDLMIAQSQLDPSHCDVVAHGISDTGPQGYVLIGSDEVLTPQFRSDVDTLVTLPDLLASLASGQQLIFKAVPPGSGERIGIDADQDCILNGFDSIPYGTADLNGDGKVNLADLATLLANYGAVQVPREWGDIDGDGTVGLSDLANLLAVFGTSCPA